LAYLDDLSDELAKWGDMPENGTVLIPYEGLPYAALVQIKDGEPWGAVLLHEDHVGATAQLLLDWKQLEAEPA
jgi:hypothetical protein